MASDQYSRKKKPEEDEEDEEDEVEQKLDSLRLPPVDMEDDQSIKFLTSFTAKGKDGLSFNDKYPFINIYASKLNLEVMTIEDLIVLYASSKEFKQMALDKLDKHLDLRNIRTLKNQVEEYGILGESVYILGQAGHSCNIARGKTALGRVILTSIEQRYIHTLAEIVDGEKWKEILGKESVDINDVVEVCDYYEGVFQNPTRYGLYLPGSAKDLLKTTLFKDLFREYLSSKFKSLCSRKGKSEIGDAYIEGIVENAISDVSNLYKNHIVVVVVNKENLENLEIVSFIGAENADEGRDIHGELICSKEDGPKGVGKLQMAAVLLAAKDAGVEFVFIQAIQGLFGVQYPLYSRFGFHAYFPAQILERKQALDQFINVKGGMMENAGVSKPIKQRKSASAQASRIQYIQHPNPINWLTSSLSRSAAALTLIPMWIDARNVEIECIQKMLEIEGHNCQGDYVFERGWLGHFQRIIKNPPNKFLDKTLSRLENLKTQEFKKIQEIAASPLSSPPETFISSASIYLDP